MSYNLYAEEDNRYPTYQERKEYIRLHKGFRSVKWDDYTILNDDEILQYIVDRAINHGWKVFGHYVREQGQASKHVEVFDQELYVYSHIPGTQQREVWATYTFNDLLESEEFFEAFYTWGRRDTTILGQNEEGWHPVYYFSSGEPAWQFQIKEIRNTFDPLLWLFGHLAR